MFLSSEFPWTLGASLISLSLNHLGVDLVVQMLSMCSKTNRLVFSFHALIILLEAFDGPAAPPLGMLFMAALNSENSTS